LIENDASLVAGIMHWQQSVHAAFVKNAFVKKVIKSLLILLAGLVHVVVS